MHMICSISFATYCNHPKHGQQTQRSKSPIRDPFRFIEELVIKDPTYVEPNRTRKRNKSVNVELTNNNSSEDVTKTKEDVEEQTEDLKLNPETKIPSNSNITFDPDEKENSKVLTTQNSSFLCQWNHCMKTLNSIDQFVEHVDSHVGSQPWTCQWSNCEKSTQKYIFGKKYKLKHHLR